MPLERLASVSVSCGFWTFKLWAKSFSRTANEPACPCLVRVKVPHIDKDCPEVASEKILPESPYSTKCDFACDSEDNFEIL